LENTYELLFVIPPDLKDDERSAVKSQIVEEMTGLGAAIEKEDSWGKRDMAFEVKDYRQGFYHLIIFKSDTDTPNKLKSILRVNEKVIRYIITKREITPEPPKVAETEHKSEDKVKPQAAVEPAATVKPEAAVESEDKPVAVAEPEPAPLEQPETEAAPPEVD